MNPTVELRTIEAAYEADPAVAAVWAKFQVGNYQYIHRWEFKTDGAIEAIVGGRLWPAHTSTRCPGTFNSTERTVHGVSRPSRWR
jgi:hypothetical protein